MKKTPGPARRGPAEAAALLCVLLALGALPPAAAQGGPATSSPVEVSGSDRILFPPEEGRASFRFLPEGSPAPFDRSLFLSAAPGEERSYQLQVSSEAGAAVSSYLIDKRRPPAPRTQPGTGLYRDPLKILLSSEAGASIFWALVGPEGSSPFVLYAEGKEPSLQPPAAGTVTYTLLSYAVDAAGNRSYPSRSVYRLAEPNLSAAAPQIEAASLVLDPAAPAPEIILARGYAELKMKLPEGSSLLLDIQPPSPPQGLDDFERIASEEGVATLRFPCPYGWQGRISVYFGSLSAGTAVYNPKPLSISLSNPTDESPATQVPEEPQLSLDPLGRGAFALFPSYDGQVFVSLDGAEPRLYETPLALPLNKTSVKLSWYGEGASGRKSATRSLALSLPQPPPDVGLQGIAEGAVTGADVSLSPSAKAALRYELRVDGSLPPEPTSSSPLMGDSLSLACPVGEERSVILRYRSFAGAVGGEGKILRFTIDKKPPESPSALALSSYSDKSAVVDLRPGAGAKDIYASVSADGELAPFILVKGGIECPGSDAGPVTYIVRAYDVDAAGNRSTEMKSLSFIVDRSSIYASDQGMEAGDGSPDKPYRSLDEAMAAALRLGKRSVNLRGSFELRLPLRSSSNLALRAGFGANWSKDTAARVKIGVRMAGGGPVFDQAGGSLSFQRIDLSVSGAGSGALIRLKDAALGMTESSLAAAGEGDLLLVSAQGSRISLDGAKLKASKAMAFTAFSAESSDISMTGSSIIAEPGVRIFGAFDMDGGSLSLAECLLESHSDLGLSLFALRSSSFLVDRSLVKAEGGSGFMRLGSFKAVRGEVKNSKFLLSWNGPGTLFDMAEGGPSFRHDTILADSDKAAFRFFDVQGPLPELWNSIFAGSGRGSELLRSSSPVGQGVVVADCLWGFDRFITGAGEIGDLEGINALNIKSALFSSKPVIGESPARTFAAPLKSQAPLRPDSACVDAALPLERGYETDYSGHPRPAAGHAGPDIGADESTG